MDEYGRFSFLYDPIVTPALRPMYEGAIDILTRHECRSVIDLCCGTGELATMCARAGLTSTGVDLSPFMLKVARKKNGSRILLADATALPLPDNSFDAATISFGLHEKPHETAMSILNEASRVTRPDGIIIVADYRQASSGQGKWTGMVVRCIERMAGKEHFTHFRRYMDLGATDGFLSIAAMHGKCKQVFLNGWAGLYTIRVRS